MKKPDDIQLTPAGLEKLKQEYQDLQNKRPSVLARMVAAREQGDLSENAGYHASKEELAKTDHRMREIKYLLRFIKVVKSDKSGEVKIGSSIVLNDGTTSYNFTIVGQFEADPVNNKLSNLSPIGAAVLGKKVGDKITIDTPDGKATYKLVDIES